MILKNLKLKAENINSNPIETVNQEKDEQIYSKVIDNFKLELDILKALILACLTAIFGIFGYSVIKR